VLQKNQSQAQAASHRGDSSASGAGWRRYIEDAVHNGPVAILLAEHQGRRNAATISFFSEVAHHPTTLWVSLEMTSYTWDLVQSSGRFSLSVLHQGQARLALECGTHSGREKDKCSGLPLHHDERGFAVIDDCLASAWCEMQSSRPVGTHMLVIAAILAGTINTKAAKVRHLLISDVAAAVRAGA
jgi:flavin reductase (DIM6/NTAB) family NADH-FMN oxidoreductase RutF